MAGRGFQATSGFWMMPKAKRPHDMRFWAKVDKSGDCWLWTGYMQDGRPKWSDRERGSQSARNVAYRLSGLEIVGWFILRPRCGGERCVKPEHMKMEGRAKQDYLASFWRCVDKNGPTSDLLETHCWIWVASKCDKGYGMFRDEDGATRRAHIVSFRIHGGTVPDGLELSHLCDTPSCVRPDHLKPDTHRGNMLYGNNKTAVQARRLACGAGHLREPGKYRCRLCSNERTKQWKRKTRAAKKALSKNQSL